MPNVMDAQMIGSCMREHKRRLTAWLKDMDLPDGETLEEQTIKRLAAGHLARSHHGKGMILMDIYFILPQRTRRLYPRIVVSALKSWTREQTKV